MANIKPAHLKQDSNPSRQKKNEEEKHLMKDQFSSTDLMDVPDFFFLRNELIYGLLVQNLKDLGLGIHLKDIDIFQLVEIANTIDMLAEFNRHLAQNGSMETITTREGQTKTVVSQAVSARNTTLSTLQSQLKSLQLDPQSRQLLTSSVLNDVNMATTSFDEDDDNDLLNKILERIEG